MEDLALAPRCQHPGDAEAAAAGFFQANHIEFVDPLPALKAPPLQPYFENGDGHPNPVGHAIIASEVAAHLSGSP